MNAENARRIAEREERDRPKISEADVEAYDRLHYPEHFTPERIARNADIPPIPGNRHIAQLDHARFHEWFGTECDDTCPHPPFPVRVPWWKRLFSRQS
jgi:hypothetical protein